jgi:hypothetical protein
MVFAPRSTARNNKGMRGNDGKGSISSIDCVIRAAIAEGASAEALWKIRGKEGWEALSELEQRHRSRSLLAYIQQHIKRPGFVWRAAAQTTLDDIGMLGLVMKTVANLRTAWALIVRYHHIWTGRSLCRIEPVAGGERFLLSAPFPREQWFCRMMEYNIAALMQLSYSIAAATRG